eukprot:5775096-Pyramimonas_sp.AAC.1
MLNHRLTRVYFGLVKCAVRGSYVYGVDEYPAYASSFLTANLQCTLSSDSYLPEHPQTTCNSQVRQRLCVIATRAIWHRTQPARSGGRR